MTKLYMILFSSILTGSVALANQQQVLDALYIPLEYAIKQGRDTTASIGYLNAYLEENNLTDTMMPRSSQLVQLYGEKDPTLYFLLLKSKDKRAVRAALEDDLKNYTCSSLDEQSRIDFLCLFFEIAKKQKNVSIDRNCPISLDIEIEQKLKDKAAIITVTLSNNSNKGRYVMSSPDAMDYIGIRRIDGVPIPAVHRNAPVVPVYLNSGEIFTKRCVLRFKKTTHFNDRALRKKYPIQDRRSGNSMEPFCLFYGMNIPHVELNGDIIGFGDSFIPVQLFAQYDEEKLYSRLIANSFDKNRMPWVWWNSKTAMLFKQRVMPVEDKPVEPTRHKWYPVLIRTQSNKMEIKHMDFTEVIVPEKEKAGKVPACEF